jgi:2,4-dienoyl-CoA reductase-like NADH-dependent reductase (Old Yellow Enzyme family)
VPHLLSKHPEPGFPVAFQGTIIVSKTRNEGLFSPTSIGAIAVANRIAMAPLTRSRAGMDGVHSRLAIDYYRQRASAGLIISEATNISQQGRGYAFTPGIYSAAQVAAWRPITDAVHKAGGRIVCQLWHVGRMSHVDLQEGGAAPVAPSALQAGELIFLESRKQATPSMPRALAADELADILEDYRNAARRAIDAIASGHADMTAFGRPFIGNPDLVERLRRNASLTEADRATYYGGGAEGYTDYKTIDERAPQ